MGPEKHEYVNRTQGWIGVTTVNRKGDDEPGSVEPGGRVFLTDEERVLTERAYKSAQVAPFHPREIVWRAMSTGEVIARFHAPQLQRRGDCPDPLPEVVATRELEERLAREEAEREQLARDTDDRLQRTGG